MKNADAPKSHLLSHEVNVELNMLRATMMNGVGREVDCRDIVTVDNGGLRDVKEQLLEKQPKPQALGDGIGHSTILSLSTGAGYRGLSFRRPRYKRGTQVDAVAGSEATGVRAANSIGVTVGKKVGQYIYCSRLLFSFFALYLYFPLYFNIYFSKTYLQKC